MGKQKSATRLRRLQKRAEERGETYVPPTAVVETNKNPSDANTADDGTNNKSPSSQPAKPKVTTNLKRKAAVHLKEEITVIEKDEQMNAKQRRSAKRKAEAIALESSGFQSATELLEWYETTRKKKKEKRNKENTEKSTEDGGKKVDPNTKSTTPHILFIGQLSYTTTKQQLHDYLQEHLSKHHPDSTPTDITVRLLTDPTTKKSRGMAFCQLASVDILTALLELHHTVLNGRRLNVERTAGSGKHHKSQQLAKFATQRTTATAVAIADLWKEYPAVAASTDAAVAKLCERHALTVVRAAVERFVETEGPTKKDNPSAYLTALVAN